MSVLVTAASRHGATTEIARAIADVLSEHGLDVDVVAPEAVSSLDGYTACVVGSGVYAGRWLDHARTLIEGLEESFRDRSTWLFSSGPIGDPPRPDEAPVDVAAIVEAIGVREHRIFPGRLDKSRLSFGEKAIVLAFRAPEGDFRPWDEIRAWANEIATTIRTAS